MLRLVIAVDGSETSVRAIDAAARLAKHTDVEAVLLHVRPAAGYHGDLTPREYERIGAEERDRQARVLETALAHARQAGLERAITQAEAGTPDVDIPRVATDRSADFIVMGTRGLTGLARMRVGSTVSQLLKDGSANLLIAHVPDPEMSGAR